MMMKFNYPPGATPLNGDELGALIPSHITTQQELNVWEEKNILQADEWAFRQKEILSVTFIKELHEHMFNETWKWAGKFRLTEKNIGIPHQQISIKTKALCDDVYYQLDNNVFSKDEIAVRFHYRLTYIHPFSNGNGRHARLMADLLITQQRGIRFSWGMHQDLFNPTPVRKQYIESLRLADHGDYSRLLIFSRS